MIGSCSSAGEDEELAAKLGRPVGRKWAPLFHESALVELGGHTGRFAPLIGWMREHLAEPLTVERLADCAAMSPRNFARAFTAETGTIPAKAVERLRLEIAPTAVETSRAPLERIAEDVGFGDAGQMRRAFIRSLGHPPQVLRRAARPS